LPGSRRREIDENLPLLLEAAAILQQRRPQIRFVLPHLRASVDQQIRDALAAAPVEVLYAPGCFHRVMPQLQAAWVASGTALLEVAAHRVPPVLVYRVSSRLGAWLSRNWLAVPSIGSLNLIAGYQLAPEHLGRQISPEALADDLEARLDGPERTATLAAIEELRPAFGEPGPAARTAAILAEIVE
jgi:lipid-A-disaccharide synthase